MCMCMYMVLAGSDGLDDCTCKAGYTGSNGGACTACEAGKCKETSGGESCSACPGDSTSPAGAICSSLKRRLLLVWGDTLGCGYV